MAEKVRIVVAGDQRDLDASGAGMKALSADHRFHIIGIASGLHEALWAVRALRPDLVLLTVGGSIRMAREILASLPFEFRPAVLLVTQTTPIGAIAQLLQAGANGVVSRASLEGDLLKAIPTVLNGELWIDSGYWKPLIAAAAWAGEPAAERCTEQEREILTWVVRGLGNKEIAQRLGMSLTGVKSGLQRLFQKFGVRKRAQLVSAAAAFPASISRASDGGAAQRQTAMDVAEMAAREAAAGE